MYTYVYIYCISYGLQASRLPMGLDVEGILAMFGIRWLAASSHAAKPWRI